MSVPGITPLNAIAIREAISRAAKTNDGFIDWQAPDFELAIGNRTYMVSAQHIFKALDACGLQDEEVIDAFKTLGVDLTPTNIPNRRKIEPKQKPALVRSAPSP
jgi:hypothetical protein